jgi:CRP-like cAMP-binding protein
MPRTHRIDFEGARHHVMNRGARRTPVFTNDEARGLFVVLTAARGRRDNRPRWVAAWWRSRRSGLTHRQVSRVLGCQPSGVSHMLARLRAHSDDDELATWLATLEERARAASGGPEESEM